MASGISVIIPHYNRVALLGQTLKNLLAQSQPAEEIIVVDDHSQEDLQPLVQRYEQQVIFLKTQGKGPGAARNTGMQVASGRFIQFFDSDDLMVPDKLAEQLDQLKSSEADMVWGPYFYAQPTEAGWTSDNLVINSQPLAGEAARRAIYEGFNLIFPACLFRRDLLREAGPWPEALMTHEDFVYMHRILCLKPQVGFSPGAAMLYRLHPEQLTDGHTTQIKRGFNHLEALRQMKQEDLTLMERLKLEAEAQRVGAFLKSLEKEAPFDFSTKARARKLMQTWLRAKNKIGRLRTRSPWQPHDNVRHDPEQVRKWIEQIEGTLA